MSTFVSSPIQVLKAFQTAYPRKAFRKNLGQNFLIDLNILKKIVTAADFSPEEIVVEIGSGLGFLTQLVAPQVKKVIAVEVDPEFVAFSQDYFRKLGLYNVQFIQTDFLSLTNYPDTLVEEQTFSVIGNLPYALGSRMLKRFLEVARRPKQAVLLFQKEVARKLDAKPGSSSYGFLSLWTQYHAEVARCFQVGRRCFYPAPKVDSELVKLRVHVSFPLSQEQTTPFFSFVSKIFQKRRKTLVNALLGSGVVHVDREKLAACLRSLGKNANVRPAELSLQDYLQLFSFLQNDIFQNDIEMGVR